MRLSAVVLSVLALAAALPATQSGTAKTLGIDHLITTHDHGDHVGGLSELATPPGAQAPAAPQHDGPAHWLTVSARTDGSFTVTNSRSGFSKAYQAGT